MSNIIFQAVKHSRDPLSQKKLKQSLNILRTAQE